jgi:hypothetical protein
MSKQALKSSVWECEHHPQLQCNSKRYNSQIDINELQFNLFVDPMTLPIKNATLVTEFFKALFL